MPHAGLSATIARTRRAVAPTDAATDGQLLAAFLTTRDPDAFARLVARFGPMVFAVCRRLTGHHQDAEDAFQAAFVVLARRADTVSPREAVGNWLYGVAVRVAKEARAVSTRRRTREVPTATLPEVPRSDVPSDDVGVVLHEELEKLPEKFRTLLVLCDLRGEAQPEVAQRLGLAVGTVYSRLSAARKELAKRLRGRGLVLSVGAHTGALAGLGHAAVPHTLASRAVNTALTPEPIPAAIAALTNGVFQTMLLQKLTLGSACAILLALAGLAAWSSDAQVAAQEPVKQPVRLVVQNQPDNKKAAPVAKPVGSGTLVLGREGAFWVLNPDGKKEPELPLPKGTRSVMHTALSPDGTRVACLVMQDGPPRVDLEDKPWPFEIVIRTIGKPNGEKVWEATSAQATFLWTADGKKLIVSQAKKTEAGDCETVLLDPETGKTDKSDVPAGLWALDCSKDGKTFLVQGHDAKTKKDFLGVFTRGDKEPARLCELRHHVPSVATARLSPDGKTVLLIDADPEQKDAHKWDSSRRIYLVNLATKKRELLPEFPENGQAHGVAWSPDGKQIAYTWQPLDAEALKKDMMTADDVTKETEGFLMIADANGKNARTVASDKGMFSTNRILGRVDWR